MPCLLCRTLRAPRALCDTSVSGALRSALCFRVDPLSAAAARLSSDLETTLALKNVRRVALMAGGGGVALACGDAEELAFRLPAALLDAAGAATS